MPIPSSSGYPQYSNSLITPVFNMDLLERFYASTVYSDISSTQYTGELKRGGDQITFQREPKVMVRDYSKNGKITHDTIDSSPVTMTIDYAKTFSLKMNMIDEHQIQNFDKWKASFLDNAGKELSRAIDPELLTEMWTSVAPSNEGANAGVVTESVDLGSTGSPISLTKSNIIEKLSQVHQVLDEAMAPRDGRFIVVPPAGLNVMRNSDLRNAYATALNFSPMVNGKLPDQVMGFNVLESQNMKPVMDGAKHVFHLVAGVKMATAFASQIEDTRTVSDKDDWANYYQGLNVYGFKVLYDDALAHLYAEFA